MTHKRRLATAVIAIALIAVGSEVLIESIAVDGAHQLIESRLSKAAGLEVRFGREFHLEIVPVLRFEANAVTVTDPQRPSEPLLSVGSLLLELDPWQLLFGVISIDELELFDAELTLDSDAVGGIRLTSDAVPLSEKTLREPMGEGTLFRIHRLDAEDLRILYRAGTTESSALLEIDELSLEADEFDDPVSVAIRGSFKGSSFEVEGEIGALPQLSSPTTPYPVSLRARFRETEIELMGSIQDPLAMRGIEIDLRLDADDLGFLEPFVDWELALPPVGPVTATTTLRGHPGAFGAEELVLRVGRRDEAWLEMDGSVGDLAEFKQVHLVATFGVADLQHAQSLIDRELPDVGPIRGNVTLSDRDGTLGIETFQIAGGREGTLEIDFSGAIDHWTEKNEIDFDAKIKAKHLAIIGSLLGVDLPPIGPVSFSGHMSGADEGISAQGRARLDETVFVGNLSGSFIPGTRPKLRVRIRSQHLHLADVGIEPLPDRSEQSSVEGGDIGNWWSGNVPLPFFQKLRALDADIALEADRVTGRSGLELKQVRLAIQLDDGNLVISDVAAGYQTGTVNVEARIDARTSVPSLALKARLDNVDLTTLIAQLDEDTESAGLLDALIDLESRGSTPAEIRSNLAGSFRLLIRDGALASKYGSAFVKNVVKLSLPSLITHRSPHFGCIVAEYQIADGVATVDNLVLDSEKARVVGAGTIDIGADVFDLRLQPTAKQPGLLNLTAVVDVSGPLAAPKFSPRLRTVPGNIARGLISNVLAPGSALLVPFRNRVKTDALCAQGLPVEPRG